MAGRFLLAFPFYTFSSPLSTTQMIKWRTGNCFFIFKVVQADTHTLSSAVMDFIHRGHYSAGLRSKTDTIKHDFFPCNLMSDYPYNTWSKGSEKVHKIQLV